MPQLDVQYTGDLEIDAKDILGSVETLVKEHDSGTGNVKGRALKVADFHHSSLMLTLSLVKRPHRDDAFMSALAADLSDLLGSKISQPCNVSLTVQFLPQFHVSKDYNS